MNKPLDEKKSKTLWNRILSEAENLPVLPDIVNQVLQQIENPNSNPKIFEDIISKDPILTAKVLKMSNSAYYGFSREIDTLSEAVLILGLNTLKSLAIAASAFKLLNQSFEGYGLSQGGLWKHSLSTAMAARMLAKILNYQDTEKFFVAGLLHDIGKILLSKFLVKYVNDIKNLAKMREISFEQAEKQFLGFNHCDVGAELALYWKLPDLFLEATKYHHSVYETSIKNTIYIKIVHIADIISYNTKIGLGIDGNHYLPKKDLFKELNIDKKVQEGISKKIRSSMAEFERALI